MVGRPKYYEKLKLNNRDVYITENGNVFNNFLDALEASTPDYNFGYICVTIQSSNANSISKNILPKLNYFDGYNMIAPLANTRIIAVSNDKSTILFDKVIIADEKLLHTNFENVFDFEFMYGDKFIELDREIIIDNEIYHCRYPEFHDIDMKPIDNYDKDTILKNSCFELDKIFGPIIRESVEDFDFYEYYPLSLIKIK